jgi:hypothetical protein
VKTGEHTTQDMDAKRRLEEEAEQEIEKGKEKKGKKARGGRQTMNKERKAQEATVYLLCPFDANLTEGRRRDLFGGGFQHKTLNRCSTKVSMLFPGPAVPFRMSDCHGSMT